MHVHIVALLMRWNDFCRVSRDAANDGAKQLINRDREWLGCELTIFIVRESSKIFVLLMICLFAYLVTRVARLMRQDVFKCFLLKVTCEEAQKTFQRMKKTYEVIEGSCRSENMLKFIDKDVS